MNYFCNKYIYSVCLVLLLLYSQRVQAVDDVKQLTDVGIEEHLGDIIPLDLEFTNSNGQKVKLSEYFLDNKPVILNLVYFSCPRVCNYAINSVVEVVNKLSSVHLGKDFKILTVSFDERDNFKDSELKIADFFKLMKWV